MPIYEYLCDDCGTRKEHIQKISAELIAACPNCASHNYRKQLTAAGFQLKGSGWYATDFKGTSKPKEAAPATDTPAMDKVAETPSAGCAGSCACHPVATPNKTAS